MFRSSKDDLLHACARARVCGMGCRSGLTKGVVGKRDGRKKQAATAMGELNQNTSCDILTGPNVGGGR